jgi:hypothetical protein
LDGSRVPEALQPPVCFQPAQPEVATQPLTVPRFSHVQSEKKQLPLPVPVHASPPFEPLGPQSELQVLCATASARQRAQVTARAAADM